MAEPNLRPDYRRYILHEFGHAIGCIHEHQTPIAGIDWNKPVVYKYYWDNFRWPQDKVDLNVLDVLSEDETNHSDDFDPDSIMVYPILAEHTNDGYHVDWGFDLSQAGQGLHRRSLPSAIGRVLLCSTHLSQLFHLKQTANDYVRTHSSQPTA